MIDLRMFSETVLEFQAIAQDSSVDRFQEAALGAMHKALRFDTAWWGIMSREANELKLHYSLPYQLPSTWLPMWERCKHDDTVALTVHGRPKYTTYFDSAKLAEAPGLHALTQEHDIGQVLCTSIYMPSEQAFVFLSLYRSFRSRAFTDEERELNQYLMLHLSSSWTANRLLQLEYLKANAAQNETHLAIVDGHCQIMNAEAGFLDLLVLEWPASRGLALPQRVIDWFRSTEETLHLSRVVLRRYSLGEMGVIAIRRRSVADALSSREREIAYAFSRGSSYKQVAREMNLSPATVRHHLRSVYVKLNVSDKAEMATYLHANDLFVEGEELLQRYRSLRRKLFV